MSDDTITDELDEDLDNEVDPVPSLPDMILERLAEVAGPRASGRTTALMKAVPELAGKHTDVVVVFNDPKQASDMMAEFVKGNEGAVSHFPVHYAALGGTRFWFTTLEEEPRIAGRVPKSPRLVDHFALEMALCRLCRGST